MRKKIKVRIANKLEVWSRYKYAPTVDLPHKLRYVEGDNRMSLLLEGGICEVIPIHDIDVCNCEDCEDVISSYLIEHADGLYEVYRNDVTELSPLELLAMESE